MELIFIQHHVALQLVQSRPGQTVFGHDHRRRECKAAILKSRRNFELALVGGAEREAGQIPFHLKGSAGQRTTQQGRLQIVAPISLHRQGQIAGQAGCVSPAHAALQIQNARVQRSHSSHLRAAPSELQLARGIRIGKAHAAAAQLQALAVELPLQLTGELVKRHQRLCQQVHHIRSAALHRQGRLAAGLV